MDRILRSLAAGRQESLGSRQVSVIISAAFDGAFKASFSTADQKIKGLGSSLKTLKNSASDIKSLKSVRVEIDQLSTTLATQRANLDLASAATAKAKAALDDYKGKVTTAKDANASARETWHRLSQELKEARKALKDAKNPTEEMKERIKELRTQVGNARQAYRQNTVAVKDSEKALSEHSREAIKNKQSVEHFTAAEKVLTSAAKATEVQLERSSQVAKNYAGSLEKAGRGVLDLEKSEKRLDEAIARRSRRMTGIERQQMLANKARDLRSEGRTNLYSAIGFGYSFFKPIQIAAEFESAMIRVKAMAGANMEEYRRLTSEARRLGSETIFSATEVAAAQNELATAGFKTNEIIQVMPGLLGLADASMSSLAVTAEISAAVLRGFGLDVTEMGRVGDVLTAAFTSSASSLETLGETMKYVAPVASAMNISLEQSAGMAAILSNVGIKGSMAGTAMRSLFLRLSDPPAAARKVLQEMNVQTRDAAGNMRDIVDIIHDVNRALEGAGSSKRAGVWKKLSGEEAAASGIALGRAEKSGALKREIRNYELAPSFNLVGKRLVRLPDSELKDLASGLGVRFNRALSETGMTGVLAKAFSGAKGKKFESRLQTVYSTLKIQPTLADMKKEELDITSKKAEAALRKLKISPFDPYAAGAKTQEELTAEISAAISKLPESQKMRYVELFFSRTRNGVRDLALEIQRAGPNTDKLVAALGKVNNVEKTRTELSGSAKKAWDDFKGDVEEGAIILGNSVLPALIKLGKQIKPIAEEFTRWLEKNKELVKQIMLIVGGVFAFNAAVGIAKFSLSGLVSIFSGVQKTWNAFNFVRDQIGDRGSGTRKGLRLARIGFKKSKRLAKGAGRLFMKGGKGAWNVLKKAGPSILEMVPKIGKAFSVVGSALMSFAVANPILLGVIALVVALGASCYYVYKNWATIGPKWNAFLSSMKLFFVKTWDAIKNSSAIAWEWIKTYFSWVPLVALIKNWEPVVAFFKGIYEMVKPYLDKLFPSKADIEINGNMKVPEEDSKPWFSSIFDLSSPKFKVDSPRLPDSTRLAAASSGRSYSQRNAVTVNAQITLDGGEKAPRQVAQNLVGEVRSAFSNFPSFDLFDPVVLS